MVLGQVRSLTHFPTHPADRLATKCWTFVTGFNQALVSSIGREEENLVLQSNVLGWTTPTHLGSETHRHTQTHALQVHQTI